MKKILVVVAPVALFILGEVAANAGQTINGAGAFGYITDKWDEKEPEKGHKLDYAGRCVSIPNNPAEPKYTMECVGKYEFTPDESWKGNGTCTNDRPPSSGPTAMLV